VGRHDSWPADFAIARDRRRAATISEDGVVRLWDLVERKEIDHWPTHPNLKLVTNRPSILYHGLIFTPDGSTLISSGPDKAIRFWDVDSHKEVKHQGCPTR
jgi:WD40 repeat protein